MAIKNQRNLIALDVLFYWKAFHDIISLEMTVTMKGLTQLLKFKTFSWTVTTWLVMLLLVRMP